MLDFLARLQRLPLTLQTPRLRIPPTDTLNQVTLNQDLSVLIFFSNMTVVRTVLGHFLFLFISQAVCVIQLVIVT